MSCSSWFFCAVVRGCGGRVAGGSGSGGRCGAPGSSSCDGWGVGRAGPGCREVVSRGSGCARFFFRLVGWWGVGRVFSARRSLFFWFRCWSSWSCRGWGFGGCRVGLGFFLRLLLFGPGRCRFLLGCGGWCWLWVVLVLFGEFDPGSGRTLAACLTHASRTGPLLFWGRVEWRTGEYHVSNLPSSPG